MYFDLEKYLLEQYLGPFGAEMTSSAVLKYLP